MSVGWKRLGQNYRGNRIPVHVGLRDGIEKTVAAGGDFVYIDNAYWGRSPNGKFCRVIRNEFHLTRIIDRPDDRRKRFDVRIAAWRKTGRDIIVIPPSDTMRELWPDSKEFVPKVLETLRQSTGRPIIVKWHKHHGKLLEMLRTAWAVVTYQSVAALEAALYGVPVFATPRCVGWPINAGPLEKIDTPEYHDREPWVNGLAYANWSIEDADFPDLRDYDYR